VSLIAAEEIIFQTATDINDKKSIRISALGTDSKITFNASQSISINTADRNIFYTDSVMNFYAFSGLFFLAGGPSIIDNQLGIEVLSTHPYADIIMATTDFFTGTLLMEAPVVQFYGERGLDFNLFDDDDANPVGNYEINSQFIVFEAQNAGVIDSFSGGDIVIIAPVVHIHAGDDFLVNVNQRFELNVFDWDINTVTPITFAAPNGVIVQTANAQTSYNIDGDVFIFSENLIELAANNGDVNIAAGAQESGVPRQSADILTVNSITINSVDSFILTGNLQTVDFVDGLVIPTFFVDGLSFDGCGNTQEFFYNAVFDQFCYCTTFGFLACAATMLSFFPVLIK